MAIITLTTDWGQTDFYTGIVKGGILNLCQDAVVVDISNEVEKFNITQAAFILRNCYKNFPDGTIHIIGIDTLKKHPSIKNSIVRYLLLYNDKQYFICADNGILSMMFNNAIEKIIELETEKSNDFLVFPEKGVFVNIACYIAKGGDISKLGKEIKDYEKRGLLNPVSNEFFITGSIIHIDSYGNIITNIDLNIFEDSRKNREFSILFRKNSHNINKISNTYSNVDEGDVLALFNSSGFLEIAINKGNAGSLLGLKVNDSIRIEFIAIDPTRII